MAPKKATEKSREEKAGNDLEDELSDNDDYSENLGDFPETTQNLLMEEKNFVRFYKFGKDTYPVSPMNFYGKHFTTERFRLNSKIKSSDRANHQWIERKFWTIFKLTETNELYQAFAKLDKMWRTVKSDKPPSKKEQKELDGKVAALFEQHPLMENYDLKLDFFTDENGNACTGSKENPTVLTSIPATMIHVFYEGGNIEITEAKGLPNLLVEFVDPEDEGAIMDFIKRVKEKQSSAVKFVD